MKSRLNVIVLAFLVVVGVLVWTIVRDRRAAAAADRGTTLTIRVESLPPVAPGASPAAMTLTALTAPVPTPATTEQPQAGPPTASLPAAAEPIVSSGPAADANGAAQSNPSAGDSSPVADGSGVKSKYTAQPGDTVSNLAAALPGGNLKVNRDAVINANPSLQQDPDRVLAGKTYQIPANAGAPKAIALAVVPAQTPVAQAAPEGAEHQLKYIARAGDTVSTLAAALLGSDTKENRDAIIGANASLQTDPDRVIAGQTYRIPVRESQPLAAAPANEIPALPRATAQPDADHLVLAGSARELRYTAQPGDTVATLASALLGSDTKENRAAIIDNNKSLKQDPDHVIAGKAYWIPAPTPPQP